MSRTRRSVRKASINAREKPLVPRYKKFSRGFQKSGGHSSSRAILLLERVEYIFDDRRQSKRAIAFVSYKNWMENRATKVDHWGATGEEKSERRSCVRVAPLRWNATRIRSTSTHDREVT